MGWEFRWGGGGGVTSWCDHDFNFDLDVVTLLNLVSSISSPTKVKCGRYIG